MIWDYVISAIADGIGIRHKTLTCYQDLKTPYNDELAMGLQQKIGKNVIARANYVYREAHDQISKSSRTDSATKPPLLNITTTAKPKRIRSTSVLNWPNPPAYQP